MSDPKLDDLQIEARLQVLEVVAATLVANIFKRTHGGGAHAALTAYRQELWDLMGGLHLNRLSDPKASELQAEMRDAHDRFYKTVQTYVGKE